MRNATTKRFEDSKKIFQYLWPMKKILVDIPMVVWFIINMLFIENKKTGTNLGPLIGFVLRALLGHL